MYAGRIVESASVADIFHDPQHPYTRGLLACVPTVGEHGRRLGTIGGMVPSLIGEQTGCSFRNRCLLALPACAEGESIALTETEPAHLVRCIRAPDATRAMAAGERDEAAAATPALGEPLLACEGLTKLFQTGGLFSRKQPFTAVAGIDLAIRKGETLAIVGESGSGKTTVSRMVLGLENPTSGTVRVAGEPVAEAKGARRRAIRRAMQPVFQDPYASLNPMFTVEHIVDEPLRVFRVGDRKSRRARVAELLDHVALPRETAQRHPNELSGGQRQRVAIARALALDPRLVVCDEAVSALDVLVQDQILTLLGDLQRDLGLSYLFITHDLAVVRLVAHDVLVMQHGRVVEGGTVDDVFGRPQSDYTQELLAAIPGAGVFT
jgi:peptide/nickel transport system ATP-binding protein